MSKKIIFIFILANIVASLYAETYIDVVNRTDHTITVFTDYDWKSQKIDSGSSLIITTGPQARYLYIRENSQKETVIYDTGERKAPDIFYYKFTISQEYVRNAAPYSVTQTNASKAASHNISQCFYVKGQPGDYLNFGVDYYGPEDVRVRIKNEERNKLDC